MWSVHWCCLFTLLVLFHTVNMNCCILPLMPRLKMFEWCFNVILVFLSSQIKFILIIMKIVTSCLFVSHNCIEVLVQKFSHQKMILSNTWKVEKSNWKFIKFTNVKEIHILQCFFHNLISVVVVGTSDLSSTRVIVTFVLTIKYH